MKIQILDHTTSSTELPLPSRGELYGDGFFTTGLVENGTLLLIEQHLSRLEKSSRRLGFQTFDSTSLKQTLIEIAGNVDRAVIRVTVIRSQAERGYAISNDQQVLVTILLSPWRETPCSPCSAFFAKTPISINPYLAGIKHLNRLDNVLAASECRDVNQEAIMCVGNQIICGSRSNLFLLQKGSWMTPKLDCAGIEGLTRRRLIGDAEKSGIHVLECELFKDDLMCCEAAFVTNSLVGIWPICRIEKRELAIDLVDALRSHLNFCR